MKLDVHSLEGLEASTYAKSSFNPSPLHHYDAMSNTSGVAKTSEPDDETEITEADNGRNSSKRKARKRRGECQSRC